MPSHKQFLRAKDVAKMLSISESTVWRWVAEGRLPKPVKIGPRVSGWEVTELEKRLAGKGAQEND